MSEEFVCGALFSKPDVRDYVAYTDLSDFPKEFELDMPKVKNQLNIGSCVAHALSTVVEYFSEKEIGKYEEMSTGYIYGNRRLTSHKGTGMYTRDAIATVAKYGDVPNAYFPANIEVPYAIEKFENEVNRIEPIGYHFKFAEYFKLKDELAIKTSIMENGPVVFSMFWFDDIKVKDGVMHTNCVKTSKTGGHCMVIYGWNDIGWKVQNSWGSLWGNGGAVVVPYDVPMKEAWGIKDAETTGNLTLKKPFKTKMGAKIAKVLNYIISFVYNIMHKTKE
jgi:C1A family cysteine protease